MKLRHHFILLAWSSVWQLVSLPWSVQAQETPAAESPPTFTAEQIKFFQDQVQPILKNRCLKCHGGEEKIRSGFKMTSRKAVLRGGDLGEAVSLKEPNASSLLKAIRYEELEMPPSGRMPAAEVETLTRWVREGLPWTPGADKDEPETHAKAARGGVVDDAARQYWAYQPIKRPAVPTVQDAAWGRQPIDAFLLAKLEKAGLKPAQVADRVTLIRRAYYDLTGLPPTPAAVAAFVADKSPNAYEKLIDQLLESPHYGEKWGRHWLDLVRYAETNGYERDNPKPEAWRYRDYVIDSFQKDKPFDQFIREQLAGDELDDVTIESLTATGFYRLGIWDDEPADRELAKFDVLDGVVSTTAQVFLGMSIGCARCHEHKRDPIPHRDYYRLLAFFRDVSDMNGKNIRRIATAEQRKAFEQQQADKLAREGRMVGELYQIEQKFLVAWEKQNGIIDEDFPRSDLDDLRYRFYRDTWERLPEFDNLKHETDGVIANNYLSLGLASRSEAIGIVWEGQLKVPADGEYTFDVTATEGFRLKVGGQIVADRPEKGPQTATAKVSLKAGLIPLRLDYFNTYAKPMLRVGWTGPDGKRRPLSDEAIEKTPRVLVADSRKEAHDWSYTTEQPGDGWQQPAFDASGWKRGPAGFGQRGTPGAIVRTPWQTRDIWLRTRFVADPLPRGLALDLHHDDHVEVYLNGQLVYQAKGFLKKYERITLDDAARAAVRQGENTLAIHCQQTTGGQYIDAGLVEAKRTLDVAREIGEQGSKLIGDKLTQRYAELAKQLEQSTKTTLTEPGVDVMCVTEAGRAETQVLLRGNPHIPGEKVEPGIPAVFTQDPNSIVKPLVTDKSQSSRTSGKRRALAEWLVQWDNPLTARVFANRLWQYHFGRGIVPTSNDFGQLGEAPTHPELLDWIASEFREGGWQIKRMHKQIMLSQAYQMTSQANPQGLEKDPGNHLFWRYPMRRLTAEELRDSILLISGQLNTKAGGPSVYPKIPKEVLAGQSVPGAGWGNSPPAEAARRSVYVHIKRSLLLPILSDYDVADTDSSCPIRYTTTVPTQALGMLNGEFTNEQARHFAERLRQEAPGDVKAQVGRAITLATSRIPTDDELSADLAFIADLRQRFGLSEQGALTQYCLLVINSNAFVYLD